MDGPAQYTGNHLKEGSCGYPTAPFLTALQDCGEQKTQQEELWVLNRVTHFAQKQANHGLPG